MVAIAAPSLFVLGANHRSSTAALRERLFIEPSDMSDLYGRLRDAGLPGALVLSTCDRVEVQAVHAAPESVARSVRDVLVAGSGISRREASEQIYTLYGEEALRHAFAVACSLDSTVVGEPQVLGQVREAHRLAASCGMMNPALEQIVQAAYRAAKRVRSETEIGRRAVSLASVAAQLARDVHGDLTKASCLVVGLGDMGALMAAQLRAAGLERQQLSAPSRRTEVVAKRWGAHFVPFDHYRDALKAADVVVTAAGLGRHLLDADDLRRALAVRRRRPVVLFDTGVPNDVAPAVDALEGVFLFGLDDLERVSRESRSIRAGAATIAWQIVDEEVSAWASHLAGRGADPEIVALRDHFEQVRRQVLSECPAASAEEATRLLVNRLLHRPSRALRADAAEKTASDAVQRHARLLRVLFGLDASGGTAESKPEENG